MNLKLLLLSENIIEVDKISFLLTSIFPQINIYKKDPTCDIVEEIERLSPDVIIFDIDNSENHFTENLNLI